MSLYSPSSALSRRSAVSTLEKSGCLCVYETEGLLSTTSHRNRKGNTTQPPYPLEYNRTHSHRIVAAPRDALLFGRGQHGQRVDGLAQLPQRPPDRHARRRRLHACVGPAWVVVVAAFWDDWLLAFFKK